MHTPSAAKADLRCEICDKTFQRQEHLTRHRFIHTNEKPFQCPDCTKCFTRRDTLDRHTTVHSQSTAEIGRRNSTRACGPCAFSRIRCSRGLPCVQCDNRGRDCVYAPISKPKKNILTARRHSPESLNSDPGSNSLFLPIQDRSLLHGSTDGVTSELANDPYHQDATMIEESSTINATRPITDLSRQAEDIGITDYVGLNWWSPEPQVTENWILDQALLTDWQVPTFSYTMGHMPGVGSDQVPLGIENPLHEQTAMLTADHDNTCGSRDRCAEARSSFAQTVMHVADTIDTSTHTLPLNSGKLYAEGLGGRLAFGGKTGSLCSTPNALLSVQTPGRSSDLGFTASSDNVLPTGNLPISAERENKLSSKVYEELIHGLRTSLEAHTTDFDQQEFPSSKDIELFVTSYYGRFDPTFPFIHKSNIFEDTAVWPLVLAVAAVGARLQRSLKGPYLHALLANIVQKKLFASNWFDHIRQQGILVLDAGCSSSDLVNVQIAILNLMLTMQDGSPTLLNRALMERAQLVEKCESMNLFRPRSQNACRQSSHSDSHPKIDDWLKTEARLRAGLMIWLLDGILAYQAKSSFRISALPATVLLPASDELWQRPSWTAISKQESCSLMDSLDSIWINKSLPADMSHFSYICLVFAIYRKVEDVALQSHSRLSIFTPVALPHGVTTGTALPNLLSADELYGKWRNSACDSLDVLHWSVNAQIAKSGGLEPPCTLVLHLSRLLILSPVAELQSLAEGASVHTGMLHETQAYLHESRLAARTRAVRWVLQDRFKARLCLVHAGALYWYVRRYRTDSPVEPFAIYLATLVLWAYSAIGQVCTQLRPAKPDQEIGVDHGNDRDILGRQSRVFCSPMAERNAVSDTPFIYLDRPCDDEMVQNFVRDGHLMTAFITGAGDITAKGSADKILQVGALLLKGESSNPSISDSATAGHDSLPYVWAIQKQYADSLLRLSSISN